MAEYIINVRDLLCNDTIIGLKTCIVFGTIAIDANGVPVDLTDHVVVKCTRNDTAFLLNTHKNHVIYDFVIDFQTDFLLMRQLTPV
mgnify:FL=1|jgi:hypothetical protein